MNSLIVKLASFSRAFTRSVLLVLLLGALPVAQAAIPAAERAVLDALYTSTNGTGWTNKAGWGGAAGTECSWFGIVCNEGDINVEIISLGGNGLTGNLPNISSLKKLRYLGVYDNLLGGQIPPLSGLTQLQYFLVSGNQLAGSIPSLSDLSALVQFDAFDNRLTGSIPSLSALTALKIFRVGHNQLTGTIPSLSGLWAVQNFSVADNQLTGAIPSLRGLSALVLVDVSGNQLTGPIPPLNEPTVLEIFRINSNQLTGQMPAAPASLTEGLSSLCGNSLTANGIRDIYAAWVTATGTDWLACQATPSCTLTAVPASIFPGSMSTLTANCAQVASYYQWKGGTCVGTAGPTCNVTPTATTTYSVTGSNATGTGNIARATVTPFSVQATVVNKLLWANFTYNSADLNQTGSVYVFGYLPANSPLGGSSSGTNLVPAMLTTSGWKQINGSGTAEPVYTGTLDAGHSAFLLYDLGFFDQVRDAGIICAAYATSTGTSAPSKGLPVITGNNATISCPTITLVAPTYHGLWWNPDEPGWGMSVTQHGSMAFNIIYTFDSGGRPAWYAMSSCPISQDNCTGDIYQMSGGTSATVFWNGLRLVGAKVGSGTLSFTDPNTGKLNYTLNGITGVKPIARQVFATGTSLPTVDYTDLWWNASESGWGVGLTQEDKTIFATLYSYDATGKALWYVASSCLLNDNRCTGDLYLVTGGPSLTSLWNGSNKLVAKVGSVTFAFSDANNGTMTYSIDGVSGSRFITRQEF